MKTYKKSIYLMIVLCAISFGLTVCLHANFDQKFLFISVALSDHKEFVINILIGVFSSGLLVFITSLVSYKAEKEKLIRLVYFNAIEASNVLNILMRKHELLIVNKHSMESYLSLWEGYLSMQKLRTDMYNLGVEALFKNKNIMSFYSEDFKETINVISKYAMTFKEAIDSRDEQKMLVAYQGYEKVKDKCRYFIEITKDLSKIGINLT